MEGVLVLSELVPNYDIFFRRLLYSADIPPMRTNASPAGFHFAAQSGARVISNLRRQAVAARMPRVLAACPQARELLEHTFAGLPAFASPSNPPRFLSSFKVPNPLSPTYCSSCNGPKLVV